MLCTSCCVEGTNYLSFTHDGRVSCFLIRNNQHNHQKLVLSIVVGGKSTGSRDGSRTSRYITLYLNLMSQHGFNSALLRVLVDGRKGNRGRGLVLLIASIRLEHSHEALGFNRTDHENQVLTNLFDHDPIISTPIREGHVSANCLALRGISREALTG